MEKETKRSPQKDETSGAEGRKSPGRQGGANPDNGGRVSSETASRAGSAERGSNTKKK